MYIVHAVYVSVRECVYIIGVSTAHSTCTCIPPLTIQTAHTHMLININILCTHLPRLNVDIDDMSDDYETNIRKILHHILPVESVRGRLSAERITYMTFIDRLVYELVFFDLKQSPLYRLSVTGPLMKRHVDPVTATYVTAASTAESESVTAQARAQAAGAVRASGSGGTVHRRTRQTTLLEQNTQIKKVGMSMSMGI